MLKQPVPGSVYVIVLEPGSNAVIMPPPAPGPEVTVANNGLLLLHVPPPPVVSADVAPLHRITEPDTGPGAALTVMVAVRKQPVGKVYDMVGVFNPDIPTVALAIPKIYRMRPQFIYIKTENSPCVKVLLNDKLNERFVGSRSFDLSPAAVKLLGETPHKAWSKRIILCSK